jgi:hypothetical protein
MGKPLLCLTQKAALDIIYRAWPSWSQQEGGVMKGLPRVPSTRRCPELVEGLVLFCFPLFGLRCSEGEVVVWLL